MNLLCLRSHPHVGRPQRRYAALLGPAIAAIFLCVCGSPAQAAPAPRARPKTPRLPLWERALRPRWARSRALLDRAVRAARARRYAEATRALQEAVRLRPYAPALWFALGSVYSLSGQYRACVRALRRCRALSAPEAQDGLLAFRLGFCLSLSGQLVQALSEYRRARGGRGVTPSVLHWNIGDTRMALGRLAEATAAYRAALRSGSREPVLYYALAVALHRQGRFGEALRWVRTGLRLDPRESALKSADILWLPAHEPHYYWALVHLAQGRLTQAAQAWRRYLAAAPGSPWRPSIAAHLARLAARPLGPDDITVVQGAASAGGLARLLSRRGAALRRCLAPPRPRGPRPERALPTVARLRLAISRGRRPSVRLEARSGPVPAGAEACAQRSLRTVRWPRPPRERGEPITITVEVVSAPQ